MQEVSVSIAPLLGVVVSAEQVRLWIFSSCVCGFSRSKHDLLLTLPLFLCLG